MDRLLSVGEGRTLKRLQKIAQQINSIEDDYLEMSDEELRGQTEEFRERLEAGETLDQLLPEAFEAACASIGQPLTLRRQPGYDHGYYFIQSFIADHLRHHAALLMRA